MQALLSTASSVKKKPFLIPQLLRAACIRSTARPNGKRLIELSCLTATHQAPKSDMAVGASSPVAGLEPANVWAFFEQLTQIPRPSKHEEKVLQFLKDFADKRKLAWQQDGVGNIVIKRPGSSGGEEAPAVVIQGHVDMVTEKNSDVAHDFFSDPLRLRSDGTWLKAEGTTLGADNGLGVAAALALLDQPSQTRLPPLECLFTVDEETGLTGAFSLDASMLSGRVLLNLDTEDWGEIFIGCAGGGDSMLTLPVALEAAPDAAAHQAFDLSVTGLMGGHSGLNIAEDRGNAVRLAARVADAVMAAAPGTRLARIAGGDKRNAIPREAAATLLVPVSAAAEAAAAAGAQAEALQREYGALEAHMAVRFAPQAGAPPDQVLGGDSAAKLLALLLTLPHGVVKNSHTVPGLVETSTNLASVKPEPAAQGSAAAVYRVNCSTRSSLGLSLEATRGAIAKLAGLVGAEVEQDTAYPGWLPNPGSKVVQLAREVLEEVTGHSVKVGAIHAGLECGIIGEKVPGIDMVSYGPTIRGAHSPDERVEIATVAPFYEATLKILERLADSR